MSSPRDPLTDDLTLAQKAMDARDTPLDPRRKQRLWRKIEAQTRPQWSWWLSLAGAGAFGVAVALLISGQFNHPPPPVAEVQMAPKAPLGPPEPVLQLSADAEYERLAPRSLRLKKGTLQITLAPSPEPWAIEFAAGRLAFWGGQLQLSETQVLLTQGRAELTQGQLTTLLVPGQKMSFAAESASAPAPQPKPRVALLPQQAVEEARRWVQKDASLARVLAENVLKNQPPPAIQIQAWMVLADALRREGRWRRAAETYGEVAQRSGVYREEAFLRQAQMLSELGQKKLAIQVLQAAEQKVAQGLLMPERAALHSELLFSLGQAEDAAQVLNKIQENRSQALQMLRLKLAHALIESNPGRLQELLAPVLADPRFAAEAQELLEKAAPGGVKNF